MQKKITKLKRSKKNDWSPQKVAEYSSIIDAQHVNFMIGPKILLPLSVACIGLLVGISNNFSFSSLFQCIAFICSILAFFMTILFIIGIYGYKFDIVNIKEKLLKSKEPKDILLEKKNKADAKHAWLAACIATSFMVGILSLVVFGGISIYEKYNFKKSITTIK